MMYLAKSNTLLHKPLQITFNSLRTFSRAEILKSLDQSKIARRKFIKTELTENPEFFKAYPHLQQMYAVDEEKEEINEDMPYDHDLQMNFKDATAKAPYFESLL